MVILVLIAYLEMVLLNKILYVVDSNCEKNYHYDIESDTIIYHFSINSSINVDINIINERVKLYYYYNNINYDDNIFSIQVHHLNHFTQSELFIHGVNALQNKLDYNVEGIVDKEFSNCICNQENQIINLKSGKSKISPILKIDNYNVDSNHSAYIGRFSEEKLFYMMSRGLTKKDSYRLLLNGFLLNSDSLDASKIVEFTKEINII